MEEINHCPVFNMYSVSRKLIKAYSDYLDELNITYTQYLVITVLSQKNSCTVDEIGKILCLDSGTLTPLLKRLEQKNILIRQHDLKDERRRIISLTQQGLALKENLHLIRQKVREKFQLSELEVKELKRILGKIDSK